MKDSYTFDRDAEGLDHAYALHERAYERIFERLGLEWYAVEADVGMMGGVGAHEYMAPCAAGENEVALADGYAASVEVARADPQPVELGPALPAPEVLDTPGMTTIEQVAGHLSVPSGALLKALPLVLDGGELKLLLLRGDHRVNEIKLANALGGSFRWATREEIASRLGPPGSIGPVGVDVPVLLDAGVAPGPYVTGAGQADRHLRGVEPGRDFAYESIDARAVVSGDTVDGRAVRVEPAIEVGNIFKLGTQVLRAARCDVSG